jgi:basic membrane protein A
LVTGRVWWGMKEGAIDLVAMSDVVPASIKTKVETIKSGLKDGSFTIWKGPVVTTEGKVVLAAGEVATDQFLGRIDFYVKGVEGLVPTGK